MNYEDSTYSGYLYLGTPVSMPAKLVFDTGSSFLAVTSNFCQDNKNFKYRFQSETLHNELDFEIDSTNRCKTMAYHAEWSKSGISTKSKARIIKYGSAGFQGFEWKDFTCLQPLKT